MLNSSNVVFVHSYAFCTKGWISISQNILFLTSRLSAALKIFLLFWIIYDVINGSSWENRFENWENLPCLSLIYFSALYSSCPWSILIMSHMTLCVCFFKAFVKSQRSFFNIKIRVVYNTFISTANVPVLICLMLHVVQEEWHDCDWCECCYWSESIWLLIWTPSNTKKYLFLLDIQIWQEVKVKDLRKKSILKHIKCFFLNVYGVFSASGINLLVGAAFFLFLWEISGCVWWQREHHYC